MQIIYVKITEGEGPIGERLNTDVHTSWGAVFSESWSRPGFTGRSREVCDLARDALAVEDIRHTDNLSVQASTRVGHWTVAALYEHEI